MFLVLLFFLIPRLCIVLIVLIDFQKVLVESILAKKLDKSRITFNQSAILPTTRQNVC